MPSDMPGAPERPNEGVFDEPWQAQAFALTVALNETGAFEWGDWATLLSKELHAPDAKDDGSDYYARWTAALETLLVSKGIVDADQVADLAASWQRAAAATPHGTAIELINDPEASAAKQGGKSVERAGEDTVEGNER